LTMIVELRTWNMRRQHVPLDREASIR
jgi:hypothetical protein